MSLMPLRVLIVDDSSLYRQLVARVLATEPDLAVVGQCADGVEALAQIAAHKPDVITLDLRMPRLDGLAVLRHLAQQVDAPAVLMLSGLTFEGAAETLAALELGAVDFVLKPMSGTIAESEALLREELLPRMRLAGYRRLRPNPAALPLPPPAASWLLPLESSGDKEFSPHSSATVLEPDPPGLANLLEAQAKDPQAQSPRHWPLAPKDTDVIRRMNRIARDPALKGIDLVAIGISTGGPRALAQVIPALPALFAVPILIVQHMPPMFTHSLAAHLNEDSALNVREAVDGDEPRAGEVLLAPGGFHMGLVGNRHDARVQLTTEPPENSCRPAVDYLFRSLAKVYGNRVLALVMTGMGQDGFLGAQLLKQQGATIWAQDEASCVVFGMPRRPIERGLVDMVFSLDELPSRLVAAVGERRP